MIEGFSTAAMVVLIEPHKVPDSKDYLNIHKNISMTILKIFSFFVKNPVLLI